MFKLATQKSYKYNDHDYDNNMPKFDLSSCPLRRGPCPTFSQSSNYPSLGTTSPGPVVDWLTLLLGVDVPVGLEADAFTGRNAIMSATPGVACIYCRFPHWSAFRRLYQWIPSWTQHLRQETSVGPQTRFQSSFPSAGPTCSSYFAGC